MAEAAVEERGAVMSRYYCHKCDQEINIPNLDFICPICAGGFVEELPARPANVASTSTVSSSSSRRGSRNSLSSNRFTGLDALRGEIATLLMSRNGPNVEISIDPGNRRAGGRVRSQNLDRLDNVLIDFLHSLSGGDVELPFGNSEMLYLGNMGDYAWGREGIDTIVTQLLNQMETSGPPPMPKEKIAEIPKVEVTEEEADRKIQCSVCWEDFQLKEVVRKLPCTHIFHENCIVPWLDLHGTCPICRKSLLGDESEEDNTQSSNQARVNNSSAHPLFASNSNRGPSTDQNSANNGSTTNSGNDRRGGRTSQTQSNTNNVFAFDDGNVDLD